MTAHFDGRRYRNSAAPSGKSLWRVIWWLVFKRRARWPQWVDDVPPSSPPPAPEPDQLGVTFVNHSTFLLQFGSLNVLTDPIWSQRCSPVSWTGPKRVRRPGIDLDHLPPIDIVLVSHNHYDHMDVATLRRLEARHHPLFITGQGNRRFLQRRGLQRVEELNWWQSLPLPGGEAILTPAQHFTRRGLFDMNRTLWGGFLLRHGAWNVYFTGDSGYGPHFREIRERLGEPDVALLPIGAYEPRWFMKVNHINPEEAVQVHLDLGARQSFAMHYGTFQLTDEPIDEPIEKLSESLRARDIEESRFRVLHFGETCAVDRKRHEPETGVPGSSISRRELT